MDEIVFSCVFLRVRKQPGICRAMQYLCKTFGYWQKGMLFILPYRDIRVTNCGFRMSNDPVRGTNNGSCVPEGRYGLGGRVPRYP